MLLIERRIMEKNAYTLQEFIDDLRRITSEVTEERTVLSRVRPLAKRAALAKSWLTPELYSANQEQGYGVNVLHVEPDNTLFVAAVSWLPGRGAAPHNHGTWAVVVGVDGPERNIFWERQDDRSRLGYAELKKIGEKVCDEGDVVALPTGAIHEVQNETERTTLSFHVYGRHLNHTGRSQFDPTNRTETLLIVKTQ
jgi:predicted metal-dependent enzyme (double-stranded beta helix superfamily)